MTQEHKSEEPKIKYIELGSVVDHAQQKHSGGYLSYGYNNALCFELIDLYNDSSKHNALVTSKINYILGEGLKSNDLTSKRILQRPNAFEDGNEIAEKLITDLELFGGYYVQLVFSKFGGQLVDVYHLPFQYVAPNENATKFFYSKDIQTKGIRLSSGQEFDAYDGKNEGTKVLYVSKYRAGSDVLTLPDYYASRKYIKIDAEIANFQLNDIATGFSAGTMVVLHNGEPTADQKKKIAKEFKKNTTGSSNAGGVFIHFAQREEQEPSIIPLNGNDLPERFAQLNERAREEIFIGHKVISPMLFGVKTEGQLGGRNEMIEAFDLFKQSYIEPKQKVIKSTFNLLSRINNGSGQVEINTASPLSLDYLQLWQEGLVDKQTAQRELNIPITKTTELNSDANEFSKWKESDWHTFEEYGESADDYVVLHSLPINFANIQFDIDEQAARALAIIQENPRISIADLLNLLSIGAEQGKVLIDDMVAEKLLDDSKGLAVSEAGLKVIEDFNPTELIVKYKYSGVRDNRNRDFCARLLSLNRIYTREDIQKMSQALGYDVWKRRGGWYHNPQLNVNIPHCRHDWEQVIVKKK
jgi:hypothetical protein